MTIALNTAREASTLGASRPGFWATRRESKLDAAQASMLVDRWVTTAYNIGLGVDGSGATGRIPQVISVTLGPSPRLLVRLRPGQSAADLVDVADRLALGMGVHSVRITPRHTRFARVDLVLVDPLAGRVPLPAPLTTVTAPAALGRVESGELLSTVLAQQAHMIVQGQTRSGKSRWCYGFLGQLASAPDLVIAGSDVTGLLLRPFAGTRHEAHQTLGSVSAEAHVRRLEGLVAEMDRRIARIPARRDTLPITDEHSLMLVVIEEYPGLLELAAATDAKVGKGSKLRERIRGAVGRLLAESAKAAMRVLLITQRAEAGIIGGFHRGQAPVRISFRVEDTESIKMLHPACPDGLAEAHLSTPAGFALVSGPELPLARMRAPHMGDYADYVDLISAACR
jgi:S-DNA-T family DNA segregation ATPase FtsK/SpoIIIE